MSKNDPKLKKRLIFITIFKCIAALLITNSHMDKLYPIAALATGGSIGNAIFFAVSGYCFSVKEQNFLRFFTKKIARLYPSIIIAATVLYFTAFSNNKPNNLFSYFIFPTRFWFAEAILIFYVIMYFLVKTKIIEKPHVIFSVLILVYFVIYILFVDKTKFSVESMTEFKYFKHISYFMVMLGGYYIKQNSDKIKALVEGKRVITLGISSALFVGFYVFKLALDAFPSLYSIQFIMQYINLALALSLICTGLSWENTLKRIPSWLFAPINHIATITLEIYLMQSFAFEFIGLPSQFPLNIIVALIVLIIVATILHYTSKVVISIPKIIGKQKES